MEGFSDAKTTETLRKVRLYNRRCYLLFWHGVIIALGHNYNGYPVIGNILFVAFCIPVGFLLKIFYQKRGSVFAPAIMHGVINQATTTFVLFGVNEKQIEPLINSPGGIIGIFFYYDRHSYLL